MPARSTAGLGTVSRPRNSSSRLPVLMYHGIHADERSAGVYNPLYSVAVDEFAAQLDWLADHGYRTTLLAERARSPRDVVLTFDDGDVSWTAVALPLLVERGMVAEFCVTSDYVDRPGRITRDEVRELAHHGMGVLSHGRTHRLLSTLPREELEEELTSSRRDLERWSGGPVLGLSAPGGRAGARELRVARAAGYAFVLNSVPGPNRRPRPGRYLHRLAVTRTTTLEQFAGLVRWRGPAARRLLLRTAALEAPKRVLGDDRYERLRAVILRRGEG
ncbi:polysaccharide deacetylase family protein [Geodermatophilus ruber]|uniref:Polysaccharide deacetylase n=1 Tax=Geodermatophilus ruber TaxID=504800 RepID=A0A1I4DJN6_9ACTN|nr:polysaccharide deacetylase family protein [Geodermatophilus ruber]SFK92960.1 Polysaccharide deacetylase [Geodermatophilus ruber]